ncbi:FeoA family protein [uncultured Methanobrevibacter sp.]|uniref:FeoA family protein n=1 Tax=Methanobrevibacter sp. TaxID=66852 RepID=UPI0025D4D585|nr:FeoA family protein [uncultured Methanobrevibacter sp.]
MVRTLKDVKPGETVTIVKYNHSGDDIELRRHLLGMGFVKGTKVHVKKVAPFGDPIEMSIRGCDVCLRKEEAENIEVI